MNRKINIKGKHAILSGKSKFIFIFHKNYKHVRLQVQTYPVYMLQF